ncbi:snRNA-activating protein complex subunit 4 [Sitodiplosis mosellana]|uniref:snRNA-activating protein complex subunit 4 n=1 Tax=Sitodiplosis mosellana TaxID=263140 RepID=UPI002443F25F|nr:snRNA-activating protein complex subunit 4 [Sitodiplosis mosellana]
MSRSSVNGSEYDEYVLDEADYVREAEQTVYNHNEISIENALTLNKHMRIYLNDLKHELEQLINVCQQKYKQNELLIAATNKAKNEPKLYTTYYFCGYPFFKDRKGGAPPQSAEYLKRTEKGDEIFPLDLEKRCVWLPRDKVQLVQGVKKQVITYLQSQNRTKIRKTVGKRCASELSARIQNESSSFESMHLKDLLKKTEGSNFRINWLDVSMNALDDRHPPNECMGMWYGYLMPTLNRQPWTPAEEDKLLNAANDFEHQDWAEIAKEVDGRSAYQCFVHYQTKFNPKHVQKNVRWTPEEDKKLLDFIEKYRIGNIIPWTKIMEKCPGRSKPQLYNRYMFSLHPEINRAPFTVEEDCILMAAIKEYGLNFCEFPSNLLPGRNMRQIRSRYNNVLRHVNVREHWTEQHDIKLMELIDRYGTSDWVRISDEMVSHTRTSCRQRYTTIRKFLDKYPSKTVSDVPRRKRPFSTNVTTENWMEAIIEAKNFESITAASEEEEDEAENSILPRGKSVAQSLHNTDYYDFLKYSFNFKFGEAIPGSDALFENIQIACQLLRASNLPNKINTYDQSFSCYVTMKNPCKKVQLEVDLLRSLSELGRNDFLYPVNVNTVLGLRGITAMLALASEEKKGPRKKKKIPETEIKPESNSVQDYQALDLFKMRFNSIFKQTATLAKMHRQITSVSLRLRNQKRKRVTIPTSTVTSTSVAAAATTTDFHNNETLVRISAANQSNDEEFESYIMSETEEKPCKRNRITVLESITVGLNDIEEVDPLQLPPPTVSNDSFNFYTRYRVETSDTVQEINIQPDVSGSETEGFADDQSTYSNTDFVIWTPTITDEATGSSQQ